MHQMRDSRMRMLYTERVPMPFVYENTLLPVQWQRWRKNPGDLVILGSHTNDHGMN